ncbi:MULTISPECIES: hypothetical protein [Kitasatospora]|uniref:Uncharacterized protein n=1 Tax=Kitasatospora setae (strain ATCC 33774 / DSM 43861 / JCM 3304 / KCC A-0304 / NBRC 14216 / KM-6054) TaxID=452652 RepID=E4MYW1_KITSK|nr:MULTISPECIES: hypothetical protein [Kitasatospora]BAJ32730.1 hypothetical protein KSE_69720 [Kitasatospora setae KM-6054]
MAAWEDVLSMLAPSQFTARDGRSAVTDPKVEWVGGHNVEITSGFKGADVAGQAFDRWFSWNFTYQSDNTTQHGSVAVGVILNWGEFNPATNPFGKFLRDAPRVLYPLLNTKANDRVSVASFEDAARMLERASWFLDGWIPVTRKWAADVDSVGSDWQGSAAGSFAAVLTGYAWELEDLRDKLVDVDVAGALRTAGRTLEAQLQPLVDAWENWLKSPESSPVTSLAKALAEGLSGAQVHLTFGTEGGGGDFWENQGGKPATAVGGEPGAASGFSVSFSGAKFGDPKQADFWAAVGERAKAIWEADMLLLDTAANTAMKNIEYYYNIAGTLMDNHGLGQAGLHLPMSTPPSTGPGSGDPDPGKGGGDGTGTKDLNLDGGGSGGTGGGSGLNLDGGGTGGGPGSGGIDLTGGGGGTGGGGTGGTGTGGLPNLIGGGTGGTDLTGGTGGTGGSTKPVTLPPGSRITDDGRIVDANGKPVLDANGNPMLAGKDYTIGPDGTLRDAKGTPVPQYRQLLTDSYAADSGEGLLAPNRFSGGGFTYHTGTLSGGPTGSGGTGLGGLPGLVGTGGGLSARALAAGADPTAVKVAAEQANAERIAAQKAAAAAAEEQALLTGRQTATSSSGMPPMMPPGGGVGAGGAPGEKDRRRTTWLAEDEEVWGTETGAVHGVIGR